MRSNGSWLRRSNAALIVLGIGGGVLAWPVSSEVNAQQRAAPVQGQGQRAGQPPAGGQPAGRGRGPIVAPLPFEDRTGFESIFNGTSLNPGEQQEEAARKAAQAAQAAGGARGRGGAAVSRFQDWDGDPKFWRVENGVIVGESTADKTVNPNTFLIWRGGAPGDFELKVEIRMNSTNSGIQYRSRMIPAAQGLPAGQSGHSWRLAGYQMDMDFDNVYPGQLYEEAGRGFLAERGTITYIAPDGTKGAIGQLKTADELKAAFKPGEWNTFHLIARGNTLIHIVNGLVTAVCVDDDLKGRSMAGLIGFQLHAGPPMKLELRNLAIKLK
jgi:hypothetical protein